MKKWKISEAKARFSVVVEEGQKEPQAILNRDRPVAVLMGYAEYEELSRLREEARRPTVSELLDELREIDGEGDPVIPPRKNRKQPRI